MNPGPASAGSTRDREIVAAKVIATCPGRNFVTLKIETRSGIVGLGDATLDGRELAVASYLQDHIVPNLIGRDAGRIEDTWQSGHGATIHEQLAAKFPYSPKQLPIARLEDGSMWGW